MGQTLGQAKQKLEDSYVKITPLFVKSRYDYFNKEAFSGELPENVTFKTSKLPGQRMGNTIMSNFVFNPKKYPHPILKANQSDVSDYVVKLPDITITINNKVKITERMFDGILLHEMIHVALGAAGDIYHGHGPRFIELLKKIETKLGRKIPIGHNIDPERDLGLMPDNSAYAEKNVIAIIYKLSDGTRGFYFAHPSLRDTIARWIFGNTKISAYEVKTQLGEKYITHRGFGKSVKFHKMYKGDDEILDAAIAKGKKIEPIGSELLYKNKQ